MAQLKFRDAWVELLIKYDARHFMGNWFLMAQSKSSSLFKYFCIATSDAIFRVREGERERLKVHLRKLFKLPGDKISWRLAGEKTLRSSGKGL